MDNADMSEITEATMLKLLLVMMIASAHAAPTNTSVARRPAQYDPTYELTKQLSQDNSGTQQTQKYCTGNPPGQDDAWCSWVCIDGKWSKVCR